VLAPDDASVGPHSAGPRTVYLNHRPPIGATHFQPGTMLVKVIANDRTFAMAKRGAQYNKAGAYEWEWFELLTAMDGTLSIEWRGTGPPGDAGYGSSGDCNSCHHGWGAYNDDVLAPELDLQKIGR